MKTTFKIFLLKNRPFDYVKSVSSVLVNKSTASGIPLEWKKDKFLFSFFTDDSSLLPMTWQRFSYKKKTAKSIAK